MGSGIAVKAKANNLLLNKKETTRKILIPT